MLFFLTYLYSPRRNSYFNMSKKRISKVYINIIILRLNKCYNRPFICQKKSDVYVVQYFND